jgi:tRNA pseudouridine32 synthase / 23S rRNA pseudouridine746 synthase
MPTKTAATITGPHENSFSDVSSTPFMLQILQPMAIHLLHEDAHLLAVSKPSGQVVIPGRGDLPGEPLVTELEKHVGGKVYVVHRLDRGASGIVLFAKNPKAHRFLSMQFENREVTKMYRVLAQGAIPRGGRVDQPLRAFGSGRMGVHPQGKPSSTEFHVLEPFKEATLLEVAPLTGRRHQIRVHLFSIGHPVMGDPLYGKDRPVGGVLRLMLHAQSLEFRHPSGEKLTLTVEPPADFEEVLTALRPS